jgi:hypothetical protein
MRQSLAISTGLAAALLLSACSSEPAKRYFPPQASLQQLQHLPDGQWQAQIRLQNFSTGAVEFRNLSLKVQIQDQQWTALSSSGTLRIGPNNAEIYTLAIPFDAATRQVLMERLDKTQSIRYVLNGSVQSVDPNRTYTLDYQGRLNPAPGLDGVYR